MTLGTTSRLLIDAVRDERGLILVLTGAGISLASGIPTFRGSDEGAVWTRDVTELGTYRYFQRDPVGSWRWYLQRFAAALQAKPNAAHFALSELERWHAGRGGTFLLVTQNIDTLHEQAGSLDFVKVHGSADRARCSSPRCPLGSTATIALADLDFSLRGTMSIGEVALTLVATNNALKYTNPVFVVTGEKDKVFCLGGCGTNTTGTVANTKGIFPVTSSFDAWVVKDAGHSWQFHLQGPRVMRGVHDWIAGKGF